MTIRKATLEDVEILRGLYEQFFAYTASLQPDYYRDAVCGEDYPLGSVQDEHRDIYIAKENGVVGGFVHVKEQRTPPIPCYVPHKYAELMEIFVCPSDRGKGTGTALLNAAKQWASARGLSYLELNVQDGNDMAVHLYKRDGFVTTKQIMRCTL